MSLKRSPVRVLILSKDPTLLTNDSGFGDTLKRHIYYSERLNHYAPGSELRIITYTPKSAELQFLNPSSSLKIYGTSSVHRAFFMVDAFRISYKVCSKDWSPTVITTQEPYEDGRLGLWLAKRYRARLIPQLHFDLFSKDWLNESRFNPLRRFIALRTLKGATSVRVVSQEQRRKLINKLGMSADSIHVIPVGVSFKPTEKDQAACKQAITPAMSGHLVVLFVGRLVEQKNMHLWIEVAQQVLQAMPDARFLIAGDGNLMPEIKGVVNSKGLEHAIIFLGNEPYDKLPEIYGAADLFLLSSHYEGFGRVIVEANMAGVPAIATTCTGPEDIIVDGETGYLCSTGDQQGLTRSVLSLLKDDAKRKRFAEGAQQYVEKMFSREFLADSLVKMWLEQTST